MWYQELKDDWPDIFHERLVERKTYVNLSQMAGALYQHEVDGPLGIPGIREKTLTFLRKLLVERKVKVMVAMPRIATDAEVDKHNYEKRNSPYPSDILEYGMLYEHDWIKVFDHTNAKDGIEKIRLGWNKFDSTVFEMMVMITLPENDFGDWKETE